MGQYKDLLESVLSENWVVSKDANGNKILINKLTGEKKPMAVANTPVAKYLGKSMEKPMALPGDEPEDVEENIVGTDELEAPETHEVPQAMPAAHPTDISFDSEEAWAQSPERKYHQTSGIMPRRR